MIEKRAFKEIIIEYQNKIPKIQLIEREIFVESSPNYVFVGLRRAGKSYMMFADIQYRLSHGTITPRDVLYINFEDDRLIGMDKDDLSSILESYNELYDNPAPLIYFDEIQNVEGWEKYVRRLVDMGLHVWVTGSNAKMLSREIATTLGGRFIIKYIPTFSFSEYLKFNGISFDSNWKYDLEKKTLLTRHLAEYFHFGGFAETFRLIEKREWINSLYQKLLLGDIISRNGYRNERAVSLLGRKLAESVKQPSTLKRLLNILKSTGASIGRDTVADYLQSFDSSYITFPIYNFKHSLSERCLESKRYFSDNGLLNNFLLDPATSLLENIVAIELTKRNREVSEEEVFFYRNGIEVDFYLPTSKTAIQVSYNVSDEETLQREIDAIKKLRKAAPVDKAYIITYDNPAKKLSIDSLNINVIPLLEFLLYPHL